MRMKGRANGGRDGTMGLRVCACACGRVWEGARGRVCILRLRRAAAAEEGFCKAPFARGSVFLRRRKSG